MDNGIEKKVPAVQREISTLKSPAKTATPSKAFIKPVKNLYYEFVSEF